MTLAKQRRHQLEKLTLSGEQHATMTGCCETRRNSAQTGPAHLQTILQRCEPRSYQVRQSLRSFHPGA
jgi:hypothetical protein